MSNPDEVFDLERIKRDFMQFGMDGLGPHDVTDLITRIEAWYKRPIKIVWTCGGEPWTGHEHETKLEAELCHKLAKIQGRCPHLHTVGVIGVLGINGHCTDCEADVP